jgi:hypothetical protein
LVEEVSISVHDVRLGELVLNERHDVGEVMLAGVLTVGDCGHGGRSRERRTEREDDLYIAPPCTGMISCPARVPPRAARMFSHTFRRASLSV